ncbi:leucine-rich repeat neuronal protein 4 [Mustela nigripes]|uniref:leucine-rich repeat neuronal protein 4-like n=1 Tax=Mustela nigripes TaxID=77151 RepID=UPI0028152A76|nr:leucine-rich repeat neuronal protein 4-like [Mustela nigripes]XP_059262544.1 leucine-rich repeat neuronal protein 4 [Mustela nigripes]
MWWALLALPVLLPTALRLCLAGPPQERGPLFWLTRQDSRESGAANATVSPCEGLPSAGASTLTLANRSLERLPNCLPPALRNLDASHNLLRALSAAELGALPQLQVLMLRHNRIAELRWGPGGPAALHTLDLSYNQLATLPPCAGPALPGLRSLALAGNPLQTLQPRAFACLPALRFLNLSGTALGRDLGAGIADGAFAGAGGALEVLDLSGTFLERVQSGWIRDLPKLTSLHLRKMPRLRTLEAAIFKMIPNLQQLDCQDSSALTSVHTQLFQDTPRLQVLLFQNCNLSSFPPWSLHSSQVLSISLFGNPLICSCELSWLLRDAKKTVLSRAADTVCVPASGSQDLFSAPLSLSQLPTVCHLDQSTTLNSSSPPAVPLTHQPSAQGLTTPWSTAPSTRPVEAGQSVTKPLSFSTDSTTQTAWSHSGIKVGTARSMAIPTADSSTSSAPRRAANTAGAEHQEHTATLVHAPHVSAASTPSAGKHPGLFPTPWSQVQTPQPDYRAQATLQAPHPSPSEGGIPVLLLDESSEEEEEEGQKEEVGAPPQDVPCDYHPCKHLQTPCAELQRRSRCRCPGLSGEDSLPDPPRLQAVTETTDTSALVHWCAPNSVVHGYQIHYSPEGWAENQSVTVVADIYATARQHPLYGLSPGTMYRVCILAANRAGLSQPVQASGWTRACAAFTTKPSFVLVFAGLCTACGLLLITTLLLAACLCRRSRTVRLQCYNTHLVAYKNPAFDYPLKLQTLS